MKIKKVDSTLASQMLRQAENSERKRAHHNFHARLDEDVHRLLMSATPETIFPIHRHPDKWELMAILQGKCELMLYNPDGSIEEILLLTPGGEIPASVMAFELPPGQFHRLRPLTNSLVLEVKKGPYTPSAPEDILAL